MASRTPLGALKASSRTPNLTRPASNSSTNTNSPSFFPLESFSSPSSTSRQPIPPNSLWFTARPSLNATLQSLHSTLSLSRAHLFRAGLLPSIDASVGVDAEFSATLPHPRLRRWMNTKEMATYLRNGTDLRSSQYKKLTSVLSHLEGLLPYADLADQLPSSTASTRPALVVDPVAASKGSLSPSAQEAYKSDSTTSLRAQLEGLLARFQQPQTLSSTGLALERIAGKDRRLGKKDSQGRVMAVGRRKESGARVWIVPTAAGPATSDLSSTSNTIPGQILINTRPLPAYFPLPTHRASAIQALTLTSSLGSFNVFAIVKGGGIAAQADAVAMGVARALVEWERCEVEAGRREEGSDEWREVLKRAKLIERDPRMVERKKTGQLKARKKFTWVKR